MGSRVLSREESEALSPEAVGLVYKFIHSQYGHSSSKRHQIIT